MSLIMYESIPFGKENCLDDDILQKCKELYSN